MVVADREDAKCVGIDGERRAEWCMTAFLWVALLPRASDDTYILRMQTIIDCYQRRDGNIAQIPDACQIKHSLSIVNFQNPCKVAVVGSNTATYIQLITVHPRMQTIQQLQLLTAAKIRLSNADDKDVRHEEEAIQRRTVLI
ncbi:hypothetical protein GUITHDRAFT_108450 [Guillardia theta CCMP2712]|uniref:Uncharacterized protein n=1 Tax=Guillardia theta (strain CCMP2712) TaxID=905079 RepID=L1JB72_GUITC|nr:hypothetical protein GUITHDRAFT_108450 [Guillardia theta CCMP2712]EKX45577.1 hypothetical protein GUITHDRAFT_108450 [Guillardia theta CCMP2712]|eukprot:XP_005832557.1 hypothetical protein GUITHDRAFT_108450 [Guillardia theta CCMP2712]